ncbi:MAG: S-methyl-5-thioribose-1-phosphate isomerase [Lachnospiraceae bacterium]|nr:S-methyl-5-thioribose-1-phosphate isomerase [Lachnospiraceae bacterium]
MDLSNRNYNSEDETVALDDEAKEIVIIDQTKLPGQKRMLRLSLPEQFYNAIKRLEVRGAPAIGVFAAFAAYLCACRIKETDYESFYKAFVKDKEYLNSSRPTAVNLSWALEKMDMVVRDNSAKSIPEILDALRKEALMIRREDEAACRAIGENALTLLKPGYGLLTHCNAGQLATSKYGTATAAMYLGHERGYDFHIYCDETRPLLQGARLTAYELAAAGMDVTLECDNMVGALMASGKIDAVLVGCDRVAANGDTANKIGTSVVATVAKRFDIPFYVCGPMSTIDASIASGADIPIEERPGEEVTTMWYERPMAPSGIKVFNPAFDVTDHSLITAIITETGIFYPPFAFGRSEQ